MKNWIILLLAVALVVAGAFLPELLLKWSAPPELEMDYQQVAITSQSSSDYSWRMDTLAEHYFGDGEDLRNTYISQVTAEDGRGEEYQQFLTEITQLVHDGIIQEEAKTLLEESEDYRICYYYLFDSAAVNGFRYAELTAAGTNWRIFLSMDVESGKLVRVDCGGSRLYPGGEVLPKGSWYDVLRSFGSYLGLSDTGVMQQSAAQSQGARVYYDANTADTWSARISGSNSAWVELRVLKENYTAIVTVYSGGK